MREIQIRMVRSRVHTINPMVTFAQKNNGFEDCAHIF